MMFLWKCLFLRAGDEEEEDRGSPQLLELRSSVRHLIISLRMSWLRRKADERISEQVPLAWQSHPRVDNSIGSL